MELNTDRKKIDANCFSNCLLRDQDTLLTTSTYSTQALVSKHHPLIKGTSNNIKLPWRRG